MYKLVSERDGMIVTFKPIGMLGDADYDSLDEDMNALVATLPCVRVLVDWERLEGWEPGAKSSSTWFGHVHHAKIERMAIVADSRWNDEVKRIRDVVAPTAVRAFPLSRRDAAMAWLEQY